MYRIKCVRCGATVIEDRLWQAQEAWRTHWRHVHPEFKAHRAVVEQVGNGDS